MSGVLFLVLYPVLAVIRGASILLMWGWFVMPAFGAPAISLVQAIGLSLFVSLFTGHVPKRDEPPEIGYSTAYFLVTTVMIVAFGFFWSLFR